MKKDEIMEQEFSSLVELLQYRAKFQADKTAYIFLVDGETQQVKITYGELDQQARAIAANLQKKFSPGQRALLLYPPGLEFISGFFGCLYAGIIAVPVYPPNPADMKKSMEKLKGIISDCRPKAALTTKDIVVKLRLLSVKYSALRKVKWIASDGVKQSLADNWHKPDIKTDNLAFLQYTSGSTGAPKGVMVSHGNSLFNMDMIRYASKATANTVILNWLPVYHDMGLIGNVLGTVYLGAYCIMMSPIAFLQKPVRWVQAISKYKASGSGAPNFAYDLCAKKITPEQLNQLDLSCWDFASFGGEPVRKDTVERFIKVFKKCGFKGEAFFQAYGMAEATLYMSGKWIVKSDSIVTCMVDKKALLKNIIKFSDNQLNSQTFVSAGQPCLGQKVIVADPETKLEINDNKLGEIWIQGPSVGKGYWNNPEQTEKTFNAYLADTGQGPFLRTEDLGFIKDGELFITGRIKDLIIIRGMNHYPQDIELTVEKSHEALRPGCCVAFSIDAENKEQLVIVQELKKQKPGSLDTVKIFKAIRSAVLKNHGLQAHTVVLIKPGTILKTSSGKIRRRACCNMFLNDSLALVAKDILNNRSYDSHRTIEDKQVHYESAKHKDSIEQVQKTILKLACDILNIKEDDIPRDADMSEYGFDSVTLTELVSRINDKYRIEITPALFFEFPSINSATAYLCDTYPDIIKIKSRVNNEIATYNYDKLIPKPHNDFNMFIFKFFAVISKRFWNIKASGIQNIPKNEVFILCPNHESHFDGFWTISFVSKQLRKKLCCFSKKEHFDSFLSRFAVKMIGAIPVDRYGDTSTSLLTGEKILRQGRSLLIHPEGTRTRTANLLPFKRGSASLSIAANAPIVPVRINGAYAVYPPDKSFPKFFDWRHFRRFKIHIRFGKPIYPCFDQDISFDAKLLELTEKIRSAIITPGNDKE